MNENNESRPTAVDDDNMQVDEDDDDLERYIELEAAKHALKIRKQPVDDKKLLEQIRRLGAQEKIATKSNIFGYYEELRKQHKVDSTLFDAIMVILSAPATQVSVERAFSAMALLLDDIRCNLSSDVIDNVLTISLNRELVQYVNFDIMPSPSLSKKRD